MGSVSPSEKVSPQQTGAFRGTEFSAGFGTANSTGFGTAAAPDSGATIRTIRGGLSEMFRPS